MKYLLQIIFIISLSLIFYGYLIENITGVNGKKYIGFGVLFFAFIFMPLFVYYRYKDRMNVFIDKRMEQPENENRE